MFLAGLRIRIHLIRIRIQHFRLNTPLIWIQSFDDQKWKKKFTSEKKIFGSKTTNYLSLGLHKVSPSYVRSLQLSKENIQHFKTWNFLIFIYFPGSFYGSGSATLVSLVSVHILRVLGLEVSEWKLWCFKKFFFIHVLSRSKPFGFTGRVWIQRKKILRI